MKLSEETVARTSARLPDLDVLEEQLKERPETILSQAFPPEESVLGPRAVEAESESPFETASGSADFEEVVATNVEREREWVLGAARSAVGKLRRDGADANYAPAEATALEAIILLTGRPAILIKDGRFFPPPVGWELLDQVRENIESACRSVGRIEVRGHPEFEWIGTGFLVAEDVVMTNRHVAEEFCRQDTPDRWVFGSGMTASIDYVEEIEAISSREFVFEDVIGVHDQFDLALLRVSRGSADGEPPPEPLTLSSEAPDTVEGRKVYAVGYPFWDPRRNDPIEMQRIFSTVYGVKRLQPGELRVVLDEESIFNHDCSTLGGNSGSCIVDIETNKVIGLHFRGRYQVANQAVALWNLTNDALLEKAGVPIG